MVALFQWLGGSACEHRGDDSFRAWLAEGGLTEEAQNQSAGLAGYPTGHVPLASAMPGNRETADRITK